MSDKLDQPTHIKPTPVGLDAPADSVAEAMAVVAAMKENLKDSMTDVSREQLGRLPSQDPPRQRPKL